MITLTTTDTELKPLDKERADRIVSLLDIKDVDYGDFFSGETCNFYDFYFDVLLRQKTPCAISIDWKWRPENIFSQLNESVLGDGFEIAAIKDDPNYLAFDIVYSYGVNKGNLKVNFAAPNQLLEDIEKYTTYLMGKSFAEVNFLEDSYSWLIVPDEFDEDTFMQLTGLSRAKVEPSPPLQPRYDARRPNLAPDHKQPQKIFFLPNIVYVEDDQNGYIFRYKKSDSNTTVTYNHPVWAGRVLAGQTVKEGLAIELQSEIGYTGRFDYAFAGYDSTLKDKQGNDVHRYKLTVFVYDKSFDDTTQSGYTIELQKIAGFNTKLFPLYTN